MSCLISIKQEITSYTENKFLHKSNHGMICWSWLRTDQCWDLKLTSSIVVDWTPTLIQPHTNVATIARTIIEKLDMLWQILVIEGKNISSQVCFGCEAESQEVAEEGCKFPYLCYIACIGLACVFDNLIFYCQGQVPQWSCLNYSLWLAL